LYCQSQSQQNDVPVLRNLQEMMDTNVKKQLETNPFETPSHARKRKEKNETKCGMLHSGPARAWGKIARERVTPLAIPKTMSAPQPSICRVSIATEETVPRPKTRDSQSARRKERKERVAVVQDKCVSKGKRKEKYIDLKNKT
jgi:hypothetical protein